MRRIPLPLLLAIAGGAAAACVLALARAATRSSPAAMHTSFADLVTGASQGLAIVVGALMLVGAYALRRRDPEAPTGMLALGASLVLAAAIARPICEHVLFERMGDYLAVLDGRRWLGRLDATGAVAIAAGIIFLGEHTERVRNLAVPLFVLAIVAHPPLAIADGLADRLGDEVGRATVWQAALGYGAIQLAFAAVALIALRSSLRE